MTTRQPACARARLPQALRAAFALPAAAVLLLPGLVQAQTAPAAAAEVTTLEAVKVTARKREESLQDVPVAVTAVSGERLETLAVKDLGDLQGQVPNLTVYAARGSNTTITTFIRGVGQADPLWGVDPGVGIYFDDVYIARPQGALLDVFDVQRVEVLRGPQGTLYGKNTVGGAVKYVSRPLSTQTEGAVTLSMGSFGAANAKASIGAATADGQWRVRAAAASLNRNGYGTDLTDGSPVSNQSTMAGRVSAGFYPTGMPLSVVFALDRTKDESNMRGFQRLAVSPFDPAKTPPGTSRYDIASGMPNVNGTTSKGESVTATWNVASDWALKYIYSHRASNTSTSIDFDGLPNKIADVKAIYLDDSNSHEVQLAYDGANASGVIGAYYFDGNAGGEVRNNFFNLSFGTTAGTVYTTGKALFGDWSFKLSPMFSLSTGIRFTDESKRAVVLNRSFTNDSFSVPVATLANFDKTRSVKNTSPRVSLEMKLSDAVKLYTTASRGFKSGGYNIRANTAAVPASSKPFEDEVLDSLEVGSKMVLDGGKVELNTALFHNKYKNVQLSVFTSFTQANGTPGFFGDFTNAGRATVQGGEVEFAWLPTTHWRLSGNLAALHAKYNEYIDRNVNVADQKKFTNSPKFQAGFNLENTESAPWGGLLRSRLSLSYRTKTYPTTDLSEAIAQNAYTLVSAGVVWERDKQLSFFLQGSNLTNKAYKTDGYNIAALGVLDAFYGAPRTFTLGGTFKF
jgi:iron complex outermembrane receptor protein